MTKEIDARGLACPAPVIQTKNAVEKGGAAEVRVLVDNPAARENVSRYLKNQGFELSTEESGGGFAITARRAGDPVQDAPEIECLACEVPAPTRKILVMVSSDRMGRGDDELGSKLMASLVGTLMEMGPELWRLVFVNSGVKLCIEGSGVLDSIRGLEQSGVSVLVCGTCLNHFGVLERKRTGETTNMLDIVTSLQLADKVITL